MSEVIRIIAAVVDKTQLTLYKADGTTVGIPQGDRRIHDIVEKVIADIEEFKFCDLDLTDFSEQSYYREAEESMNGFVRFFRAAKATIDAIVDKFDRQDRPAEAIAVGEVPVFGEQTAAEKHTQAKPLSKSAEAVAEIMAVASSTDKVDFHIGAENNGTTVVAVLKDNTIIPGIENISIQLQGLAVKLGTPQGLINFFKRVSSVKRGHSVEDLLNFMSKGELPIADDGSVLVYKRLNSVRGVEGLFVDCHSGKVKQRVGSHVFMAENMVDANRSQDCSNGLHVARRDYLQAFSGDVTVLCKLAPEDVIAVPHSDARKLRAKGYHIIAQLSAEDARRVNSNQTMEDKALLGDCIAGNHIGVLEMVEITQQRGGGLVVTVVAEATEIQSSGRQGSSLDEVEQAEKAAAVVNPETIAKNVAQAKSSGKSARQVQAENLWEAMLVSTDSHVARNKADELLAYKKKANVSWSTLGLADNTPKLMDNFVVGLLAAESLPKSKPKADKISNLVKSPTPKAGPKPVGTPRQRIAAALKGKITKASAKEALEIKKTSKKSWVALGVTDKQINEIERLAK